MTKQERKDAAMKAYKAIQAPASEAYKAIQTPAWEAYKAIQAPAWEDYKAIEEPAWEDYLAELNKIDNEPDEDIIELNGKRYQLIK